MPFIKVKASCEITPEQELILKSEIGRAIELVPGKSEQYLLLEFEDKCRLWLRGVNSEPLIYIEAAVFGNENHFGYDAFTLKITKIFSDLLKVKPENIYIKYEYIAVLGVHGVCIDINKYKIR